MKLPQRTQVAVIGSGPGGAVVASALAELGREVVVIEEGPELPQGSHEAFSLGEMAAKYRNAGLTVAFGKPKISYAEGRCLGGGSEINARLYRRAPAEVLERWGREHSVEAIDEAALAPHYEACEAEVGLSEQSEPPRAATFFHQGAKALNWRAQEVPRTTRSMSQSLLPKAVRAGAKVFPDTRVLKLRRRKTDWELVCELGGERASILAEAVFVCAGAIQTPALLQRSGLPGLFGKTLQLHPSMKVVARFSEEVNFPGMGVPAAQVDEFKPGLSIGCSISSPEFLAASLAGFPDELRGLQENWRKMAVYHVAASPSGRGSVRSLPGFRDPLVRFKLEASDWSRLDDGLKKLSQLLKESGAEAVLPGKELSSVHLFASCPMGGDPKQSSVDSFGKVRGTENLYIADASVLCSAPGVNPQGTIMAIARRNAHRFAGRL